MFYSATDLTLIIGACASAIVGIIAGIRLSRCTHIKCGCVEITREAPPTKAPPNTPANTPTSLTPSESTLDLDTIAVV
jgi:hypothetical protein